MLDTEDELLFSIKWLRRADVEQKTQIEVVIGPTTTGIGRIICESLSNWTILAGGRRSWRIRSFQIAANEN